MKKWVVLMLAAALMSAAEMVPREQVQQMVGNIVAQQAGEYHFDEMVTYYGFDEMPNAYAMIYKNSIGEPFTVVAGARWTCTPISEFSHALPNCYYTLEKAQVRAHEFLEDNAVFSKIYYWGPEEEYYLFTSTRGAVLVNTYSMRCIDKQEFFAVQPERHAELEAAVKTKWIEYLACTDFSTRYTAYIPDVPYCLWSYGCSPTASAMLFWYWNNNGYGDLVDHFFDRWDAVEVEYDLNLPNVQRELAIAMGTESTYTGGTNPSFIRPGHLTVANTYHDYSFSSSQSPIGGPGNGWVFTYLKNEIDAGRPAHWGLWNYYYGGQFINHSVCAMGYDIIVPDTFVVVHTTWSSGDYSWALWTYYSGVYSEDMVITLVPGGSNPDNIDLTWPSSLSTWMFRGLRYEFRWESEGTGTDHIKMWLAPGIPNQGYDSTYWTVLENSIPNTGSYIYDVPDESLHHRINIVALDGGGTRLTADGSYASFDTRQVIGSNVDVCGHNLLTGNAQGIVAVGNYAYLPCGQPGIAVVDISDSTLPTIENIVDIGGEPSTLFYDGTYLYCSSYSDSGFHVLSISDPVNPSVIGSMTMPNKTYGLFVEDGIAYVATHTAGLRLIDVSTPSALSELGYFDSQGQVYDVCILYDTIAAVADGTKDLLILDVSNAAAPDSLYSHSTPGIPKGVWFDGYLFVGDGPGGVGIMDMSNPAQPDSLGWFNTGGQVYSGTRCNDLLYITDGPYGLRILDISDVSSPTELGYLDSYGSANAVAILTSSQCAVADGDDGIYIMTSALGIDEYTADDYFEPAMKFSPNPFAAGLQIMFGVNKPATVDIVVYDVLGARVRDIASGEYDAGSYTVIWDGTDDRGMTVAGGIYFVQFQKDDMLQTEKVIFVR